MALLATGQITLTCVIEVQSLFRYYLLQSSTLDAPSKPTTYPPSSDWSVTEPSYIESGTNSLYFVDCTVFGDGTYQYSDVSLSSEYEAAKKAYNKATVTETEITKTNAKVALCATKTQVAAIDIGCRNLLLYSDFSKKSNTDHIVYDVDKRMITFSADEFNQNYITTLSVSNYCKETIRNSNIIVHYQYCINSELVYGTSGASPWVGAELYINRTSDNGSSQYCDAKITEGMASAAEIGKWYSVSSTIAVSGSEYSSVGFQIVFRNITGSVSLRDVKVENGNKPTGWVPAPEDTEAMVKSAIEVESDKITLSVQKQVGGQNLLKETGVVQANKAYRVAHYEPSPYLIAGETYTVSMLVTPASDVTHFRVYLSQANQMQCSIPVDNSAGQQTISTTFTATYKSGLTPESNSSNAYVDVYRYPNPSTVTNPGASSIHRIKVERGSIASAWTAAPEDIDDSIVNLTSDIGTLKNDTESRITALGDRIESMVKTGEDGTLLIQNADGLTLCSITKPGSLSERLDATENKVVELGGYISQTFDEETKQPTLELGVANSTDANDTERNTEKNGFKLRLTNQSIQFLAPNNNAPTYIDDDEMVTQKQKITDTLSHTRSGSDGEFVWSVRGNGNFGLSWRKGTTAITEDTEETT